MLSSACLCCQLVARKITHLKNCWPRYLKRFDSRFIPDSFFELLFPRSRTLDLLFNIFAFYPQLLILVMMLNVVCILKNKTKQLNGIIYLHQR